MSIDHGSQSNTAAQEIGKEHARKALALADNLGGWVTTDLVARVVYSSTKFQIKRAEALLCRLARAGFLIPRACGARKQIYIMSTCGAAEVSGTPGTNWGRKDAAGKWQPPACFAHDYSSARFLVGMTQAGHQLVTAHSIAKTNRGLRKLPDGLIETPSGRWLWVETERSRKSGPNMWKQSDMILAVASGHGPEVNLGFGHECIRPSGVFVLLPPLDHLDDRGHRIDHRSRIVNSLHKAAKTRPPSNPVKVHFVRETSPWKWAREEAAVISFPPGHQTQYW